MLKSFEWDSHNLSHIQEHHVNYLEVEEAFDRKHYFFRTRNDRYILLGRSAMGRYLFIVFIRKGQGTARVISARNRTQRDRRLYRRKI